MYKNKQRNKKIKTQNYNILQQILSTPDNIKSDLLYKTEQNKK